MYSSFFVSRRRMSSGFTLVELLLYLAIASTVLLISSLFLSLLLGSRVKSTVIAEVDGQGGAALELITQTIRNAESVTIPAVGAESSSLSVAMSPPAESPVEFDLSGGTLRIREGADAPIPITNSRVSVSDLSFSNLARPSKPDAIRIQFTITAVNPSGRVEYAFSKTFVASAILRQP